MDYNQMPNSFKILEKEIESIKERNRRVEFDKSWEISVSRKIIISGLTYVTVVIFFYFTHLPNPFLNAIVPSIAFILSTLSLSFFKKIWLNFHKKSN
jgi:hypothetical protein